MEVYSAEQLEKAFENLHTCQGTRAGRVIGRKHWDAGGPPNGK